MSREIPDAFNHLETTKQGAVTTHVQVMAQSACAAIAPFGDGLLEITRDDFARFKCNLIEGSLQAATRTKQMRTLFPATALENAKVDRRARWELRAQTRKLLRGRDHRLGHQHDVHKGHDSELAEGVDSGNGPVKARRT